LTALGPERDIGGHRQAIPPTLQQSLAARLDRLGKAREVAQIGAVLGEISPIRCCARLAVSTTPPSSRRSTGSPKRTGQFDQKATFSRALGSIALNCDGAVLFWSSY
jgi:hypothetical protein